MPRRSPLLLLVATLVLLAACSGGGSDGGRAGPTTTRRPTTTTTRRPTTSTTEDEPRTTLPVPTSVPSTGAAFPPVIAALGDSLLHAAIADLIDELDPITVQAHTVPGLSVQEGSFGLAEVRTGNPAALVVVLGTNNVWDGFHEDDVAALDALAASIGDMPCVRWVDVATTTPDAGFNEAAKGINAELNRLAASSPTLRILPWSTTIASHPEWLALDGYHHTTAGSAALVAMIMDALRQCPQTYVGKIN